MWSPIVSTERSLSALCATPTTGSRIERGEIDPSFIITYRIGLEEAPAMSRTFRDKQNGCITVVMKPGAATPYHTNPPSSRQQ
jgi:threonine dehydrogenase-like Zn-dependent dehydrogenase